MGSPFPATIDLPSLEARNVMMESSGLGSGRRRVVLFALPISIAVVALIVYLLWPKSTGFGLVEGTVTLDGSPLDNLQICFTPDSLAGQSGPPSVSVTDTEGRYRLATHRGQTGALVAIHRVTVLDIDAIPDPPPPPLAPGEPPPPRRTKTPEPRISSVYAAPATTPLTGITVQAGSQTIDLKLKRNP
jgi:hypothetical protein